uniref:Hemicentin-1 n=1 Tax=Echeneis naucrates TaxID=173247 RepID=A0A665VT70_ECHNA
MGSGLLWLSFTLSAALLSAGQDAGNGATTEDIPEGASTLAFVFDVTGSMYDDLVQVIEGASKILETSLSRPQRPLYNFALVPFHDPEIGPVTITTDPKKFQYELRELYVQGGGDCPEMSIGAIKIALEISLPGSYIYVFTDARSKDYRLTHEVLQLIQQKQSQVVFVLTGDCDDRTHIGYKAYEEIASTSSGQVFHLDKKQVNEVLKWVEEAVQSSKIHLLSTDHFSGVSNTWHMPFDPSLKEVTVALSGPAPVIEIKNPAGKIVGKSDGLTELLHIANSARVVNIKDPQPGMWTIKISSGGRHSVRMSGLSTIDFRAGFSRKPTLDFKKTSSRPIQGIPTHILLNTTGLSPPGRADRLELLSITGEVIKTLPIRYYPERQPYGLWNITEFIPPDEAFFLRVTGYDQDGFLFQRVSSVSFSSIIPDAPKVLMPATTPGYYLQRGAVSCRVESLIPYTLRFTRDGRRLGVDQLFSESDGASWEIAHITLKDEGYYECIAISSAGTGRARTFLDVSEPPPAVTIDGNVTVTPGSNAVLTCHVVSTVNFNLTWLRGGHDARLDPQVHVLANLSLQVSAVTPDHSGWYECIAINEGGVTAEKIYLTVEEAPRVSVQPQNQTFTTGGEVKIRCSASGYPPPRLVWTHNDVFIMASSRHRMTPDGTLVLRKVEKKDGGVYGCLASNQAGTDTMQLLVLPPVCSSSPYLRLFKNSPDHTPLLYHLGDVQLYSSSRLDIDTMGGTLAIKETQRADAGDYSCLAVNTAGTSSGKISLDVGAAPQFIQEPSDVSADIGSSVSLLCSAQGYPEPVVTWRRQDGLELLNRSRTHGTISQSRGGLHITNLWVEDEALYICEAQNNLGKIRSQASITVTGLAVLSVIEDQQLTLPCMLLAGNPLPERQWLHNYGLVRTQRGHFQTSLRKDGSLHIERVQLEDAGDYTCLAENAVGATNHTTTVNVYGSMHIQSRQYTRTQTHKNLKKHKLLYLGGPAFSLDPDGSLHIASPSGNETGEFICTATNAAGYASRKVQVTVYGKSSVGSGEESAEPMRMSVVEGEDAILPCEVHSVPPPTISWAKERQLISPFSPRHTLLPSGSMKILDTKVSDSGLYVCVASNIAGNLTKSIELSVLVPPSIQAGPRVIKVQVGHPVELPCVVRGVPEPTLAWTKDGNSYPVSLDGSLALGNVGLHDEGTYTCTATNAAGTDEARVQVLVLEPPFNSPLQERVANQRIAFPCPAKGLPKPVIQWLRNGKELTGNEPGVSILEDGTLLILASVSPLDNGEYVCAAVNDAGSTERKYQLKVNVPPDFQDSETPGNVSVVLSQPVSLLCDVTGSPAPVITWYKDESPHGKEIEILSAAVSDSGSVCINSSAFITAVRPIIRRSKGENDDVTVTKGGDVTLQCAAEGVPRPAVTWLKDGRPITGLHGAKVLNEGRLLQIKDAKVSDTGRYTCIAINVAGQADSKYDISVVVVKNPVALNCEASGIPLPAISWLKDGRPIKATSSVRILSVADTGRYSCLASNTAGDRSRHFNLNVLVPPQINKNDIPGEGLAPKEVKIKINSTLTLECAAEAFPAPALQWYKDGQVDILSSIFTHAQVSDTGRYTCIATNIAGEDEKDFDVNIQVPPNFKRPGGVGDTLSPTGFGVDVRDVILNNPISLYCETNAVPPPTLTWYKDGQLLASNDKVLIMPGGRVLQIPRAQAEDTGRYTCVAVNEAGEDSIQYDVRVLFPPSIRGRDSDLPDEVTVLVNKTAQLECHVDGNPAPKITWFKDNQPISSDGSQRILSNGRTLQVTTRKRSHEAICAFKINVMLNNVYSELPQIPPTILGLSPENVTVVVNNFVSLSCEATGFPPPTLSWLNERGAIQGGRMLQILKAKISDGGKYTCVAMNAAGEAYKHIFLTVFGQSASVIRDSGGDYPVVVNVLVGKSVTLECESNAVPPPTITWYKNGRMVTESANLRILAEGRTLQIKSSEVSDTGQYVCKATNVAGQMDKNFHLNIYVPPSIDGPAEESITETISNPVTFSCDASGIPPPRLAWLKNGRPIENSESLEMHIFSGGSKLQIARSQLSDSGTYTCLASNVEGKAHKSYHLTIQVPPSIVGSELPTEMGVLLHENIQLVCQVKGSPSPTIQWLKDGKIIHSEEKKGLRISPDGSSLTVIRAHTTDSGKYTCVASNTAGEEDRIFNLNVYVPPAIDGNTETVEELTTVLDSSVNIECVATGSPAPQLNWLKNGLPLPVSSHIRLLSAGQVLRITRTQVSDGGTYTCVASNRAGVDNRQYNLQVYVPPGLDGAGSTEDVTVVRGNLLSLLCIADGTPTPTMAWIKEGVALAPNSHLRFLNLNTTIQIHQAEVNDTGRYTCVANNTAGQASRHFNLKVLDPPRIKSSGVPAEVSVVVNNVLEIHCEASGIPTPSLTWLKDGRPLPQTDSVGLLRGGELLRVASAQVSDQGFLLCLANSPAGDDVKEFKVRVHVPPNIVGESTPQNISVLQNRQVTLECKSDAVPPPTLTWVKDGRPLQVRNQTKLPCIQCMTSQYTCVASNIVGKTTRQFNLAVNVAPAIKDGPQSVSVHVNEPTILECIVSGVPPPRITWRKLGAILPLRYNSICVNVCRYTFTEDGSLHIQSAQVTDTGRYLCMATNEAGTQRKRIDLQVYVPPSIADGHTNVTVTVNVQTTLSCDATGIPKPTVSWKKNGRTMNIDQNQNMYRLLSSGSLVVIAPTVDDTAVYECVVSNEAGEHSRAISLTVHVPPSLADEPTELTVTRLSPVVIACTASGVPEPTIHWTKDGIRIPKEGQGYSILPTGPVQIDSAELGHAGRYSCTAKNAAGSMQRHVQLIVQELPVIQSHPPALDVILNNPITLPCRATGSPRPTITWQKEGINIPTAVLPNGSLQISKASVSDAGTYICVAQNPAGTALGKTKLKVQVPPVISSETQNYLAPVDSSVTLQCQADGSPPPSVTWHKDGQSLSESVRQRILSSGSLQISFIQPSDTGRYTCTAANVAGTVNLEMIPPSIRGGEQELAVVENSQAQLVCVAEGVPHPSLSWEKDGNPLSESIGEYTILPSGELVIDIAQPDDAGSYTCVATNAVGQDSRTLTLSVHTHPVFTELLADVALNKGEGLLLACGVSGIPPPKITWALNNNIIPGDELVIERVSKEDAGTYTCVAENSVGTIKSLGFVYVKEPPIIDGDPHSNRIEPLGGNAILNCEVRGDPLPTIQWSKNGINIQINNRIRQLDNGSLAIYGTSEDAGSYMCVATNDAGVVERSVTLTLQMAGNWGSWLPWSPCSETCGKGMQSRVRLCNNPPPSFDGPRCEGTDTQTQVCKERPCPGGPQKARGTIIGNVNDIEFGIAILNSTIADTSQTNICLHIQGPAMRKLISILNPVYWTTAQEIGEAVNGYTLAGGVFRRDTQVEFATGEILRMTHIARGLDSDGALLLDIVVNGHILHLPSHLKSFFRYDYIQTGPGQLYAQSTRMFSIDRQSVPYSWNHTISYDPSKGKMPYLVEMLQATAISSQYHPLEEVLEFGIQASITKGDNQCPQGFRLVSSGPYCADENECEAGNPCSHACHNAMGTYYCSCPWGLTISADGKTCQDIDECSLGGNMCYDGQDCKNTIGSYRCVMQCGRGFRRTADDVNECQESNPCNQHCLNTIGSYRCACQPGFQLRNRRCIDINECRQRVCRSDQQCKNTRGGYTCIDLCPSGMTKGGNGTCVDINECRDGIHQCRYNQICENTRGSYHCTCPRGYRSQGVGRPCVDINECEQLPQPCAHQCINTRGSFKCTCPPGHHLLGDGKSCAGLERLPSYESYSYGYRTSQSSPEETRTHSLRQGFHACQQGFESRGGRCLDINECEVRDACQHECINTPGSHRCLCPAGYRLTANGKTCQDMDECQEQKIQCGANRMCFNMRGSYQCIDTPCPSNYQRDSTTGFCLKNCPPNDLECTLSPYALEYKLLSLPFGIAANQDLIRLVAYTQDGVMHPRTTFLVVDEDVTLPFALRDENLKGVLFTTQALREPHTYRMKVRALSYSKDGGIEYQTTFIVYIAVSAYPY